MKEPTLDELKDQLRNIDEELESMRINNARMQREYALKKSATQAEAFALKEKIEALKGAKKIHVTEHAIVRYFERVKGFNMREIEKEIVNEEIQKMVNTLGGTGKFPNDKGGFMLTMQDNKVVTIIV